MANLKYKGICFDDYTRDGDGHYWVEMCESCAKKYASVLSGELDDGKDASGCCSVAGCNNSGEAANRHFYVDFADELVEVCGG